MTARVARIDYAVAAIEIVDEATLPTPGHAPAQRTDEGYLIVDALIARDGVLLYSDGRDEWLEYRPREELAAAANGWLGLPVTDGHPSTMVNASSYARTSKGTHREIIGLVDIDGTAYLHARLAFMDAAIVDEIERAHKDGRSVQLSIGFLCEAHEEAGEYMGKQYAFVQRSIVPNHTAKVAAGRAGPACRVLFDGVDVPTYDQSVNVNAKPTKTKANEKGKSDDAGAPEEMVSVPHPVTGEPVQLPAWAAAALANKGPMPAAPAAPAMPAAPAAPPMPQANAMPPAPAPAAAPLPEKPNDEKEKNGDEEEKNGDEEEKSNDAVNAIVRARRKLERAAESVGIKGDALDLPDVDLKRAIVKARMPVAKIDKLDGPGLDAFVETALATEPVKPRPWGLDSAKPKNDKTDAAPSYLADYLKGQGY